MKLYLYKVNRAKIFKYKLYAKLDEKDIVYQNENFTKFISNQV